MVCVAEYLPRAVVAEFDPPFVKGLSDGVGSEPTLLHPPSHTMNAFGVFNVHHGSNRQSVVTVVTLIVVGFLSDLGSRYVAGYLRAKFTSNGGEGLQDIRAGLVGSDSRFFLEVHGQLAQAGVHHLKGSDLGGCVDRSVVRHECTRQKSVPVITLVIDNLAEGLLQCPVAVFTLPI